jgi:hypothetical protein
LAVNRRVLRNMGLKKQLSKFIMVGFPKSLLPHTQISP